jgi:hypothetical protein
VCVCVCVCARAKLCKVIYVCVCICLLFCLFHVLSIDRFACLHNRRFVAAYAIFFPIFGLVELIERCCFSDNSSSTAYGDEPRRARISIRLSDPAQKWLLFHATWIGLFTFVVGYTFYLSLPLISVAANVAIYNAAGAFVYIFCLLFGMEKLSLLKILSLVFSIGERVCMQLVVLFIVLLNAFILCRWIGGVCLVQFLAAPRKSPPCVPDTTTSAMLTTNMNATTTTTTTTTTVSMTTTHSTSPDVTSSMMGYIFVTVSTILYALYEVQYKRLLSPDKFASILSSSSSSSPRADSDGGIKSRVQTQSAFVQVVCSDVNVRSTLIANRNMTTTTATTTTTGVFIGEVCDVGDRLVRHRAAAAALAGLLHRRCAARRVVRAADGSRAALARRHGAHGHAVQRATARRHRADLASLHHGAASIRPSLVIVLWMCVPQQQRIIDIALLQFVY